MYRLSGRGQAADWVRNLMEQEAVSVRINGREHDAVARIVGDGDEQRVARDLVFTKYQAGYQGALSSWWELALPVAVDLTDPAP